MATAEEELRKEALKHLKNRRALQGSALSYLVVNGLLIGIWALTGRGYFWPGWVLAGWGVGLAMHAFRVYRPRRMITEEEVRREMDRIRGGPSSRS